MRSLGLKLSLALGFHSVPAARLSGVGPQVCVGSCVGLCAGGVRWASGGRRARALLLGCPTVWAGPILPPGGADLG